MCQRAFLRNSPGPVPDFTACRTEAEPPGSAHTEDSKAVTADSAGQRSGVRKNRGGTLSCRAGWAAAVKGRDCQYVCSVCFHITT